MNLTFEHRVFHFKKPGGTSRGILTDKHAWFFRLNMNEKIGIGECSIIPGLSPDFISDKEYEKKLGEFSNLIKGINWGFLKDVNEIEMLKLVKKETEIYSIFKNFPSIIFGFEMAILSWKSGSLDRFFDNDFSNGKAKIPINGLIWMGELEYMQNQIEEKTKEGFNCLKMKVGAIDFKSEVMLLSELRAQHTAEKMIIRVDANGAFNENNVRAKLESLKKLDIHSIEQPIAPKQWNLMRQLCLEKCVPIALDEELIGAFDLLEKKELLTYILPQYIVLKPSLHGGILSCLEWIQIAEELKINWWMTSALESNIGLNCIAQFTAQFPILKHHGLGTGGLYVNNIESKLVVENGFISFSTFVPEM